MREDRFDFDHHEVAVGKNYLVRNGQRTEKDTKTGEWRRLSIDALTCELFADHFARRRAAVAGVGVVVPSDAFVFSPDPTGSVPWNPDTMTHRYERYAAAVGISSSLKELRHYSTQLLSNGVDLRTVAGRLGHSEIDDAAFLRPVRAPGRSTRGRGIAAATRGPEEEAPGEGGTR